MADEIKTSVRQESYHVDTDGSMGMVRLNRRGEVVTPDWMQQLAMDGRVFCVSNTARETAIACGTASATFSDTDPAFLLDVPTGTTIMPLEITLNQGGTVAGGMITVLITLDDKIRYSSGGVAVTPQNFRYDEPRSSSCPFYTGGTDIVAAANTDDVTLYGQFLVQDIDVLEGGNVHWSAKNYIAPVLIGPASLVIYTYAASTQPSWWFSIKWAEFATTEVIHV
jgi:hypothetical protein